MAKALFRQGVKRKVLLSLLVVIMAMLGGCGSVPVAQDLTQQQANEIVAILSSHGMASFARKEDGGRGRFYVVVKRNLYSEAIQLMNQRGLPSEGRQTFEEFIAAKGLLPNSREIEALRLDHAMAIEIEELLSAHPAVIAVKAVVRQHSLDKNASGGASLVVKIRNGSDFNRDQVLNIVSKAVPGLKPEQILIAIEAEGGGGDAVAFEGVVNNSGQITRVPLVPFIFNWRVPEDDYNAIVFVTLICGGVIAVLGGLVGYWFGFYTRHSTTHDHSFPEIGTRTSLRIDRGSKDFTGGLDDD